MVLRTRHRRHCESIINRVNKDTTYDLGIVGCITYIVRVPHATSHLPLVVLQKRHRKFN